MEMTIDDHIEVLKSYNHGFTGCAGNLQDSIDVAVDIMCKCEKIENVLKGWNNFNAYECMCEIYEIMAEAEMEEET